jgi:hypothetical protein
MGPRKIVSRQAENEISPSELTIQTISIAINGKLTKFVRVDAEDYSTLSSHTESTSVTMSGKTALLASYLFARAGLAALFHFWH